MAAPGLTVLARDGCELCQHMLDDLAALAGTLQGSRPLPPVAVRDVDDDPELARRYGLDIPVLLLDGVKVCQHRLDAGELQRLLRHR